MATKKPTSRKKQKSELPKDAHPKSTRADGDATIKDIASEAARHGVRLQFGIEPMESIVGDAKVDRLIRTALRGQSEEFMTHEISTIIASLETLAEMLPDITSMAHGAQRTTMNLQQAIKMLQNLRDRVCVETGAAIRREEDLKELDIKTKRLAAWGEGVAYGIEQQIARQKETVENMHKIKTAKREQKRDKAKHE